MQDTTVFQFPTTLASSQVIGEIIWEQRYRSLVISIIILVTHKILVLAVMGALLAPE